MQKENMKRFEEQSYTYSRKNKKTLSKISQKKNREENKQSTTYVEQVEAQKKAIKSQILNHK